jgi:PncC family amidohydrolase
MEDHWGNESAVRGPYTAIADMAAEIGRLLIARRLTLAFAESCTGGLAGSLITDIAGSSEYFLGSAVTYAYSAKEGLLGVRHDTLLAHGAVSAETAAEMAWGARRVFRSDIAVSITGIAGPSGGTPDKPVGLVHLHLTATDAEIGERHVWPNALTGPDRIANKQLSADAALRLVLRYLNKERGTA